MKFIFFVVILLRTHFLLSHEALDPKNSNWKWMDEQIEQEFAPFKKHGIKKHMLDATMENAHEISFGDHLVRFQIIGGKVYGPSSSAKYLLEKVATLYLLPDVDLILFTQDIIWNCEKLKSPVFATCTRKGENHRVLHLPIQMTREFEEKIAPSVQNTSRSSSWNSKIEKVFWRGCCNDADNYNDPKAWTTYPRGKLCYWSQLFPDLIDAAFSGFQDFQVSPILRQKFCTFFPLKSASWEEYISHKYLIDLDGYVASTPGFAWKLLSNSVVFKQDSPYELWFYKILKPWIHYIPLQRDISDLFKKIEWARKNDNFVKEIAENSQTLAMNNLCSEHIYLYCYKAICKYASLQRFHPKVEQ